MSEPLRSLGRLLVLIAGVGILGATASADGIPPVTLKLKEQEADRFLAQWRIPKPIPPDATPSPVLPESCRSVGERTVTERTGAWLARQVYVCPGGLSGRSIGVDYPFVNATVSTLLRVELISGERYAHMLRPGDPGWRVPEATSGDARAWFRTARQAVFDGARHFAGNGVHIAFAAVLVLLGALAVSVRLATAFAAGQLVAVGISSATGFQIHAALAEIGVVAAVALLAREALRPADERRQLPALAAVAGLVHGLGLARMVQPSADYDGSRLVFFALVVIGMDAALLIAAMVGTGLRRVLPQGLSRPGFASASVYAVAVAAVAIGLGFPAGDLKSATGGTSSGFQLPNLAVPDGSGATPASSRIAKPFPDAAFQNFVAVAPFEVRHEVLVNLRAAAGPIGLEPRVEIAVEEQTDVKRLVRDLVALHTELRIDGFLPEPADRRVDFLTLDSRGALPRLAPVAEPFDTAWIGVTTVYVTERTPTDVTLAWDGFDTEPSVPATITDPEATRSVELTPRKPGLTWKNELTEDPTPIVESIAVEPPVLWTPLVSLALLGLAGGLGIAAVRGRRRAASTALARIGLAGAFLMAPVGDVALPLPSSVGATPDAAGAKRILSRVLPNIYRAFEFPTESAAYDRLALSVTGDTLTEIYLEHRRAVRMEERGGARARVEAVEVIEVDSVETGSPDGFVAGCVWTVGGTVTHFGHRHFRQNRYDARVAVVPVEGQWKIRSIEVLDEKRLR